MESDIIKKLSRMQNNLQNVPRLLLLPTMIIFICATILLHEGRLLNIFYSASYSSIFSSNSTNSTFTADNVTNCTNDNGQECDSYDFSSSSMNNNLINVSANNLVQEFDYPNSTSSMNLSVKNFSKEDFVSPIDTIVQECDGTNCKIPFISSLSLSDNATNSTAGDTFSEASVGAEKLTQEHPSFSRLNFTPDNSLKDFPVDETPVTESITEVISPPPKHPNRDCNIFKGQWVPDPEGPYYTNLTCNMIQEHQNCMKFGRPDTDFLKWRWKPNDCELPRFDPFHFLELVRGKTMAFVGDSLARNHMQSLLCLLSKAQVPEDIDTPDTRLKHFFYAPYNFTILIFWSPFLIKAKELQQEGLWNLTLDEIDNRWASRIEEFDYLIISDGNWYTRPSIYFENGQMIGCNYCNIKNTPHVTLSYANRKAFQTVFNNITYTTRYNGVTFFRTYSPSHFENGEWNKGGNCIRTKPFHDREVKFQRSEAEIHSAQMAEFRKAKDRAEIIGLDFRLLDTTASMLLRPDGHPNRYGHWPNEKVILYNDCVHWCLPGPIDVWNEMLQEMIWRLS